jgi:hypothetical protein
MTIRILESAQEDLLQGFFFYEEQQPGVGVYFFDTLSAEIDSLVLFAGITRFRQVITAWSQQNSLLRSTTASQIMKLSFERCSTADKIRP